MSSHHKQQLKRGVNAGYVSRVEQKAIDDRKNGIGPPAITKNLFRGLIGGNAFVTAKGSRGTSLESMWGANIFLSFNKDDVELLNLALRSSLADITEVVIGGEYGTPFQLGDLGFYSENKLLKQTELLQSLEQENAIGTFFLSAWMLKIPFSLLPCARGEK